MPEVTNANVVIIVEGEKKADLLSMQGMWDTVEGKQVAITTTGGCASWKNLEFAKCLTGKRVLIFHDTDEVGQGYRAAIEKDLENEGIEFKSVDFLELDGKKDFRPMLKRIGIEKMIDRVASDWVQCEAALDRISIGDISEI